MGTPISKSQYSKGVSCLKKLWLYRNAKHLATPASEVQQAIFTQGHEVGKLAHLLFPGGVLVEQGHTDPEGAIKSTQLLIQTKTSSIYEAAFCVQDLLIRADIVSRNSDGSFDLYEVKSTTSVKPEHLADAAFQTYVIRSCGFQVRKIHLVHLNGAYIRDSDAIDVRRLFTIADISEEISEELLLVEANLKDLRDLIKRSAAPDGELGSVCKNPYPCEFYSHCWDGISKETIHFIGRIGDKKRTLLASKAVELIEDVPGDFELSEAQLVEVTCHKTKAPHVEHEPIKRHLSKLKYPLYFLDFESVGYAIPQYLGTRPYEQLPFQFSLHVQAEPGAELQHHEFLHEDASDPKRACAENLIAAIKQDGGSVIAYHASFEKGRIEEMATAYPDLADHLSEIIDRLWDLEVPFAKRWYWDHRFAGSSSIKNVLPILVPSMSYKDLEIQKGDEAQLRYQQFMRSGDPKVQAELRKALLTYCEQDTLAMVKVLEALQTF